MSLWRLFNFVSAVFALELGGEGFEGLTSTPSLMNFALERGWGLLTQNVTFLSACINRLQVNFHGPAYFSSRILIIGTPFSVSTVQIVIKNP